MSYLEVGVRVHWRSASAGVWKVKRGVIKAVVPPGTRPHLRGAGQERRHTSYLVRTEEGRLYWPRVDHLVRSPS